MNIKKILVMLFILFALVYPVNSLIILNPTQSQILSETITYSNGSIVLNPTCHISAFFSNGTSFVSNSRMSSNINSAIVNYTFPKELPANIYGRMNCTAASPAQRNAESFLIVYTGVSSGVTATDGTTSGVSISKLEYDFVVEIDNKTLVDVMLEPNQQKKLPFTVKNLGRLPVVIALDCSIIAGNLKSCAEIIEFKPTNFVLQPGESGRGEFTILANPNTDAGDIINLKIIGTETFTGVKRELDIKLNYELDVFNRAITAITGLWRIGPEGKTKLILPKALVIFIVPGLIALAVASIKINGKRKKATTYTGIALFVILASIFIWIL